MLLDFILSLLFLPGKTTRTARATSIRCTVGATKRVVITKFAPAKYQENF